MRDDVEILRKREIQLRDVFFRGGIKFYCWVLVVVSKYRQVFDIWYVFMGRGGSSEESSVSFLAFEVSY